MSLTSRFSARLFRTVCTAALAAFSLLSAQATDSTQALVADTLSGQLPESPGNVDSLADAAATLEALSTVPDSVQNRNPEPEKDSAVSSRQIKSVLYLGGGENSPWFHLGVLYAVEAYSVPVDSVVGTSWGAFVGYLWTKGVSLDDIQRILRDEDFSRILSSKEGFAGEPRYRLPVSESGMPALRERFSFYVDSSGNVHRRQKLLIPDSGNVQSSLSYLRLQESILRHSGKYRIPFSVLGCDGSLGSSFKEVMGSLPVKGSEMPGDFCPYLALPAEDSPDEMAIIAVAAPLRGELRVSGPQKAIALNTLKNLGSQPES